MSFPQEKLDRAFHGVNQLIASDAFKSLLHEIWSLPPELRHEFVETVILDPEQLSLRGLEIPPDVTLQRSWFADDRPTLFCVVKHVEEGAGWRKVTATFDNPITPTSTLGWVPA